MVSGGVSVHDRHAFLRRHRRVCDLGINESNRQCMVTIVLPARPSGESQCCRRPPADPATLQIGGKIKELVRDEGVTTARDFRIHEYGISRAAFHPWWQMVLRGGNWSRLADWRVSASGRSFPRACRTLRSKGSPSPRQQQQNVSRETEDATHCMDEALPQRTDHERKTRSQKPRTALLMARPNITEHHPLACLEQSLGERAPSGGRPSTAQACSTPSSAGSKLCKRVCAKCARSVSGRVSASRVSCATVADMKGESRSACSQSRVQKAPANDIRRRNIQLPATGAAPTRN